MGDIRKRPDFVYPEPSDPGKTQALWVKIKSKGNNAGKNTKTAWVAQEILNQRLGMD